MAVTMTAAAALEMAMDWETAETEVEMEAHMEWVVAEVAGSEGGRMAGEGAVGGGGGVVSADVAMEVEAKAEVGRLAVEVQPAHGVRAARERRVAARRAVVW